MNRENYVIESNERRYSYPLLTLPKLPKQVIRIAIPKKVEIVEFYTISTGDKRIFKDKDAICGYGTQRILDPTTVSYLNLFINGVLQPKINYEVEEGKIILKTEDFPYYGTSIILQMIKI